MIRSKPLVSRIPITEARVNLGAVVRRVHLNGEYFIFENDGIPIAGLMDAAELEDYLELRDPKVRQTIQKNHAEFLAGKTRPAEKLLAELQRMKPNKLTRPPKK